MQNYQPNLDMLEDIEVEQLGLEGEGIVPKASKKHKHVVRSDIWKEFDRVIEDSKNNGTPAMMIILDEQQFRCVEREGFRLFCRDMLPNFKIPSRYTIRSDCVKMFLEERELLKVVFSRLGMGRGRVLIKALTNWGMGIQRLFCCTMDNVKNNGVAIKEMKSTFNARDMLVANGKYFHQRCVAHILNLVVEDDMKQIGMTVVQVKESVKWIKGSLARPSKILPRLENDEDAEVIYMTKKLMEKLGKYWLEEYELNPNMNKILYIAAMLDPSQKMKNVQYCLKMVHEQMSWYRS
ncbi:hypothetical protein SASPL_137869 [Salvia splendens]|uniref:hAT-like transposase RNase-H fold domain-containing protein n=1 Tax=Salvia splendens TaxID=180675 RepID=A0A8X8ZEF9_SALSN|nr:hypothetical protein SASPL_137869 [Salvia splendens]